MSNALSRRCFLKTAAGASFYVMTAGCGFFRDFDLLITGGRIADGTGKPLFQADIGIKDGRIIEIGSLQGRSAGRIIPASGLVIAPGFIDIHSHSDDELLVDGRAMGKILQGVTTEVVGQDGSSYAPLNGEMREHLSERLEKLYNLRVDWDDFKGYFKKLRRQRLSVNVMSMVGSGTLRAYVIGYEDRSASEKEIQQMQQLLKDALQQGARHLSSGLEYTPGSFASTEELVALCSVLGEEGVYSTHMRSEDDHVLQAVAEAVRIAREAGCRLNITHIKASGRRNWTKMDAMLQYLDEARNAGLSVTCDRYPYAAYSTGLASLFPLWAREGGTEAFLERLQNNDLLPKMRQAVKEKIEMLGSWDAVLISSLFEPENKGYIGRRLGELAAELNKEPFEFLRELLLSENGRGGMVGFGMSEENTEKVLAYPYTAVASDGSARATEGVLSEGNPHPRNFGTFPRLLGYYVREKGLLSLEEAVRKITSLPAQIVRLPNRGRIAPQYYADLTLFDPDTIRDTATFTNPKQYPEGIHYVIVNGKVVIDQGEHTGARPGKILT